MKRIIAITVSLSIALAGCGQTLNTDKKEYPTYGFFNESPDKSKDVCYRVSVGNVIWSVILIETIFMPVYFIGFSLFNPVRLKANAADDCTQ